MLENHLNDVNLPLDTLIEKRNKNEYLYDDLNYPVLFKYSTVITNTGEDINYFRKYALLQVFVGQRRLSSTKCSLNKELRFVQIKEIRSCKQFFFKSCRN